MPPIAFSFSWEKEIYFALERRYGRVGYNVRRLGISAAFFVLFFVLLLSSTAPSKWVMLVGFAFEVVYLLYIWKMSPVRMWSTSHAYQSQKGEADESGIRLLSPVERTITWPECHNAMFVRETFVLRDTNHNIVFSIPTRAFTSPDDESAFRQLLARHLTGLPLATTEKPT